MSDESPSTLQTLQRLLSLLVAIWLLWEMIPEHRRMAWRMAILRAAQEECWRASRGIGHLAMRAELAGDGQRYIISYALARAAERARAAYDRTRGGL